MKLPLFSVLFGFTAANYANDCNPLNTTCSPDAGLTKDINLDFKQESEYFKPLFDSKRINYTDDGLVEWFEEHGDGPSLRSEFYLYYGKIEIECQTPGGTGLVSNFFMQSDDGDELDFEFISTFPKEATTNYFGKGVTGNYDRGTVYDTTSALNESYHRYTIDWQPDVTTWLIDDKVVRELYKNNVSDSGEYDYPQSPMRVFIGLWAAGDSESSGTVEWAGGKTSLEGAPFAYRVKSFNATNYYPADAYTYADKTGENIRLSNSTTHTTSHTTSHTTASTASHTTTTLHTVSTSSNKTHTASSSAVSNASTFNSTLEYSNGSGTRFEARAVVCGLILAFLVAL